MKTTRQQLKLIVREVLVELLSEGLGNIGAAQRVSEGQVPRPRVHQSPKFDPRLDTPIKVQPQAIKEAIRAEAHGNPIMASILADTAATTLSSHLNEDNSRAPAMEHFHGTPEQVFGDAARIREDGSSLWADLAFAPSKKL